MTYLQKQLAKLKKWFASNEPKALGAGLTGAAGDVPGLISDAEVTAADIVKAAGDVASKNLNVGDFLTLLHQFVKDVADGKKTVKDFEDAYSAALGK